MVLVLYTIYVIAIDLSPGKKNLKPCLLPFLEGLYISAETPVSATSERTQFMQ